MVSAARVLAAALALLALAGGAAAQPPALSAGAVEQVAPGPGPAEFRIEAPPGSYVSGRIEAGAVPVTADLLDAQGNHLRRLAKAGRGRIDFQAMTEGPVLLRIAAPEPVELWLERIVPPSEQVAAEPEFLSPRIAALAAHLRAGGDSAGFWRQVAAEGTPLVEDTGQGEAILTFLWRGAQRNVRLFGAPSNDHEWLQRLDGSDVWFKSFLVPDTTRLSYKLAPDVPDLPGDPRSRRAALLATAQMDPLNRAPWPADAPDRFNQDATVALKNAPPQPGTPPAADADPQRLRFDFRSAALGNSREIALSWPRGLDLQDPRLVVALVFDGERAEDRMDVPRMLDTLTRQGRLPPVVAVLVPSIDSRTRARELPGNDAFADVLADELLPQVAARLGIRPDPARTVLAGASYGGLAAATVAMRRPDAFGNVLSMSGSFWWAPEEGAGDGMPWVAQQVARSERLPIRFFLAAGLFETGRGDSAGILETSRILRDMLRIKGYAADWREYAGGHDDLVWRGTFADGMIALFGE